MNIDMYNTTFFYKINSLIYGDVFESGYKEKYDRYINRISENYNKYILHFNSKMIINDLEIFIKKFNEIIRLYPDNLEMIFYDRIINEAISIEDHMRTILFLIDKTKKDIKTLLDKYIIDRNINNLILEYIN